MNNLNLISNFAEFKELKNIDKSTMIGVLEDVFRHAIQKQYGTDENFDVIINPEKGDLEIWRNREVVADDELTDPVSQISLSEIQKIDSSYEVGDEYTDAIGFEQFGRRAVLSLRQNLASRIIDLEKANIYEKYSEKVGEIVSGEIYQVWKKEVLILDDEDNELLLPKSEQIPGDFYRKGDSVTTELVFIENGKETTISAGGNGSLDAVSNALKEYTGKTFTLEVYSEHSMQEQGSKSIAAAYIGITDQNGKMYWGTGTNTDIIHASADALLAAYNNMNKEM